MKTGTKIVMGVAALVSSGLILIFRPFAPLFHLFSDWAAARSPIFRTHFSPGGFTADLWNATVSLTLLAVSVFLIQYVSAVRKKDVFLEKEGNRILLFLLLVFILMTLSISVNRVLWNDEIEHIHSAWYVENGYAPYRDFFQQHHPLLWYMLAPLLSLFGYTVGTVMVLRLVILLFAAGIAGLTFRLGKRLGGSPEAGIWAVLLLLSQVAFTQSAIEIRPDVPQVFFALLSLDQLLQFLQSNDNRRALLSGLSAAVSFLFLQKSLFFVMACGLILSYMWIRKKIVFRSVLAFAISFLIPVFAFHFYLWTSGAWNDYLLTNWLLNATRSGYFPPLRTWASMLPANFFFWLLAFGAVVRAWRGRRVHPYMDVAVFTAVFLLFTLFLYRQPLEWYFMLPLTVLAAVGGGLANERYQAGKSRWWKWGTVFFGLIWPAFFVFGHSFPLNGRQLEKIDYVLQDTAETDPVYDGNARFNVFRPDLHYLWYNVDEKGVLADYNRLSRNRFGDYDICALIRHRRPRFISTVALDWQVCGLGDSYTPAPFPGLLLRREMSQPTAAFFRR